MNPLPSLRKAFTLLELLTVMAIIIVLAALILGGIGYAQRRSATERAKAEIAALSVALESYKVDHGDFPRSANTVENGNEVKTGTNAVIPVNMETGEFGTPLASYPSLSGVLMLAELEGKRYFTPKTDMLSTGSSRYLLDPFGNAYGYSTAGTFNPTFDLWSTLGMSANPTGDNRPSKDNPVDRYWQTNW